MSDTTDMNQHRFKPDWSVVRKRASELARKLARDESGQSMTEYILILFMVVLLFNQLKGRFLGKMKGLVDKVGSDLDEATEE
ncbi:MAG: Flp family type IVb pilin [Oligoflexia bacterium]